MQVLWLLLDVLLGVVLAGLVVPIAVATMPDAGRTRSGLLIIVVACIIAISVFRRLFVTMPGTGEGGSR